MASDNLVSLVSGLVDVAKANLLKDGALAPMCFIIPEGPDDGAVLPLDFSNARNKEISLKAARFLARDAACVIFIADAFITAVAQEKFKEYMRARTMGEDFPAERSEAITAVGRDHSGTVYKAAIYHRDADGGIVFDKDVGVAKNPHITGIIDYIFPA